MTGWRSNLPSEDGSALGKELARLCDTEAATKPDAPARCTTCAFRGGDHVANNSAETLMNALKCVMERTTFWCHHVDPNGKSRACAGWRLMLVDVGQKMPWDSVPGTDEPGA